MEIYILTSLGIGHLIGDFYLQWDRLAKGKNYHFKNLVIHCIIYILAMFFTLIFVFSAKVTLVLTFILGGLHFLIDFGKYYSFKKMGAKDGFLSFCIDQTLHVICIFGVSYALLRLGIHGQHFEFFQAQDVFGLDLSKVLAWIFAVLIVIKPSNVLIQKMMVDIKDGSAKQTDGRDINAGRKIGTCERLIMVILISLKQYTAIAFILSAKSIARYDKIRENENFGNYFLLGTLVSALIAIICGIMVMG